MSPYANDKRRVNHCSFSSGRELTRRFRNSSSVASRSASLSPSSRRHRRVAAGWVYRDLSRAGSVPSSVCADPLAILRKVSWRWSIAKRRASGWPPRRTYPISIRRCRIRSPGATYGGRLHWPTPPSSPRARARCLAAARTMIRADGAELNARASFDDVAA